MTIPDAPRFVFHLLFRWGAPKVPNFFSHGYATFKTNHVPLKSDRKRGSSLAASELLDKCALHYYHARGDGT
jgi:hypothetical protein